VLGIAGMIAEEIDRWIGGGVELDPVRRDLAARLWSRARILGWMGERSLAAARTGAPDVAGSLIKLAWSELSRDTHRLMADSLGPEAMLLGDDAVARFLYSPALTVAGGTSEVNRNIIGERGLGLPKGPT
jgi:alkylation response protein AidB-like acyl-CoA dehydrogenase